MSWRKYGRGNHTSTSSLCDVLSLATTVYTRTARTTGRYDHDNEECQSICKIGTGFFDEDLQTHAVFFKNYTLPVKKSYVCCDSPLDPDDWPESAQVWQIKCADLSLTPIYKAAAEIADPERGISLGFPHFVRIRDDKSAEMATTAQQLAHKSIGLWDDSWIAPS
ncbi:DNA ligase 1-like [Glossina fuscipes fuscipes]